jgi:hypothetical protein
MRKPRTYRDTEVCSTAIRHVFRGPGRRHFWLEDLLTKLSGGQVGFPLTANLAIFLLGFFIDFFEIAFIEPTPLDWRARLSERNFERALSFKRPMRVTSSIIKAPRQCRAL